MSGLVQYNSIYREQVNSETRGIFDRLARTYKVEIEAPRRTTTDWFAQIRLPGAAVVAGYYGESLKDAAMLVATSISQSAAA